MNLQRTGRASYGTVPMWNHRTQSNSGFSDTYTGISDRSNYRSEALAMVYSPYQKFKDIFDPTVALSKGTIFAELYKPFCPCSAVKNKEV